MNAHADVASQLPTLAPRVVSWAQAMQADALRNGVALGIREKALAAEVAAYLKRGSDAEPPGTAQLPDGG